MFCDVAHAIWKHDVLLAALLSEARGASLIAGLDFKSLPVTLFSISAKALTEQIAASTGLAWLWCQCTHNNLNDGIGTIERWRRHFLSSKCQVRDGIGQ